MADWFVGPIMDKIIDACSDYLQDQCRWQTGMKEELERLRENHPKVQAVVSAYTRAQITDRNPALKRWIWQLRDAVDEADDVLDDFEYMKLEEQLELNMEETKVRSSFTRLFSEPARKLRRVCQRALKIDPNLERLEAVVKKLDKVSAEVTNFRYLIESAKQEQQELDLQLCKDRETGCLPKNDLIGRGKEKDFVMQWLRKPTNEDPTHITSPSLYKNISLLSVVGLGGMGKTTLLQHIYEDLKDEFQLKMWVCVSNDFDAKKIIADMLKGAHSESLAAVQESLKAAVQSKRFLLVLDDIWEEEVSKWENVLCPLVYGSSGSKILLTTRMDSVASAIANVIRKEKEILKINGLEEDACLEILSTHAFAGVEKLGSLKKLTDIASSVVKKISGSPLAAKVIGGVLNSNFNERFWITILNSTDVLNVEPEPGCNNIMSILRLSFTFLPQPLQNCFAFCGTFPQDRMFDKDDLVRIWIALGFIQESSIEGETLEDIGGRYFDVLVRKSFFDQFQDNMRICFGLFDEFQHDESIYYKMHDLLHDLAKSISSEECFGFSGGNVLSFKIHKNVRHLFVATENLEVLRMIKDVKNLRSLFLSYTTGDQEFIEILTEVFEASRNIRLLFLYYPHLEKMSEAFKNLRHLRYLNLTGSLTKMPRSLSSLYHLRFIIYENWYGRPCSDDFLPGDLSNLSNLRHLELPWLPFFDVPRIGKLRSLQELNEFTIRNKNGYRIGELEHMRELRKLKIHSLEYVKDATEARNAKLFEKRKLTNLFLNWGIPADERRSEMGFESPRLSDNSDLDVNVLENLKPYKHLKRLSIVSYKGVSCAKWMYDADLIFNLAYICLNGCSEWETLPPFGQLPHLKYLCLSNMPKVKHLDDAGAAADECFFPCLTELFLVNCPNLQELRYLPPRLRKMRIQNIGWKAALNCKQGSNNSCGNSKSIPLQSLEVLSCPTITSLLQGDVNLDALGGLRIKGCPNLSSLGALRQVESGIEKFQLILSEVVIDDPSLLPTVGIASSEKLKICNNDVLVSFPIETEQWFLHVSSSLRELSFSGLKSMQSLPSFLKRLSSLKILRVEEVPQLQQLLHIPASLEELYLHNLKSLQCQPTSFSAISSLKILFLDRIPLLKTLPELPSSLNSLHIIRLDKLECLPSSMSAIPSLILLFLKSIPLLISLPDLPSSLHELVLENCNPEMMRRYKKISGSDWHKIAHIPYVRILTDDV